MSKTKAVQLLQTGEIVAIFWATLALKRLTLNRSSHPDTCCIGTMRIEWLNKPRYETEQLSSKTAFIVIPLRSGFTVEMMVTIGSVCHEWIPRKIEWKETTTDQRGSFSFADTAVEIMVCDQCGHEYSPLIPEWPTTGFSHRHAAGCYHCPDES